MITRDNVLEFALEAGLGVFDWRDCELQSMAVSYLTKRGLPENLNSELVENAKGLVECG